MHYPVAVVQLFGVFCFATIVAIVQVQSKCKFTLNEITPYGKHEVHRDVGKCKYGSVSCIGTDNSLCVWVSLVTDLYGD